MVCWMEISEECNFGLPVKGSRTEIKEHDQRAMGAFLNYTEKISADPEAVGFWA